MFQEISYKRHADNSEVARPFRNGEKSFDHIFDLGYVSAYMHHHAIGRLAPLLQRFPGAEWLTVGDDSWGRDAYFLNHNGASALASGLSRQLADLAIEAGHYKNFEVENAEALSFEDGSFDFVLCKHSFHHFPRPFVAFHEMLRVARKGIVLIEPAETGANHYEPVGNYLYRVCLREIEKAVRGVNLPAFAIGWDNALVPPKMGSAKIVDLGAKWDAIIGAMDEADAACRALGNLHEFYNPLYFNSFTSGGRGAWLVQMRRFAKRVLSRGLWRGGKGWNYPQNVIVIVFKCPLSGDLKNGLESGDYTVAELEPNPYIGAEDWPSPI